MFKSKYSTVLTVILILVIIAIIIIATVLSVKAYNDYKDERDRKKIYATLQEDVNLDDNEEDDSVNNTITDGNVIMQPIENTINQNTTTEGTTPRPTTRFYKEYPMIGYIKIQKTNLEYPILLDVSQGALDTAVGVEFPNNPTLNEPGNVVIIGHNYRNGKFFADNKKLVIGDKIQITDLKGKTLTYTIYEIMTIPDTDTEYVTRDRGNNIEISLSTCTDDGNARLVILARVE